MARVLCFCRRFHINPENAEYVKDGVPMCRAATCQQVAAHVHFHTNLAPAEPIPDADSVAEPYARYRLDRDGILVPYGRNTRYLDV